MKNKRSTKDLALSSNERLYLNKNHNSIFNFPLIKNITSEYLNFYTFHSGFKKKSDDLLIVDFKQAFNVFSVYSRTSTPSAPILWDKKNNKGVCKLLIVNSGNANAHTGEKGIKDIDDYTSLACKYFNCLKNEIMVSSTGVIGERLNSKKIKKILPLVAKANKVNLLKASKAIMTTDTFPKTAFKKIKIGSKTIRIFGIAKGSGMIFPNMGTMLAYIFIEADISKPILKKLLNRHIDSTFNAISVDGDTSTSDTLMIFSLKDVKKEKITKLSSIEKISKSLKEVMLNLSLQIVSDGEGISKLMQIDVTGAKSYKQASNVSFSVGNSALVKTAIAGQDANWGRVIMAIGKGDNAVNQNKIKLSFGNLLVASNGKMHSKINLKKLDSYMKRKLINIKIDLGLGKFKRTVFASDLTHEYIRINADYRS